MVRMLLGNNLAAAADMVVSVPFEGAMIDKQAKVYDNFLVVAVLAVS